MDLGLLKVLHTSLLSHTHSPVEGGFCTKCQPHQQLTCTQSHTSRTTLGSNVVLTVEPKDTCWLEEWGIEPRVSHSALYFRNGAKTPSDLADQSVRSGLNPDPGFKELYRSLWLVHDVIVGVKSGTSSTLLTLCCWKALSCFWTDFTLLSLISKGTAL